MADFELQGMPIFVYMKEKDTNKTLQPVKLINGVLGASFKVQPATIEGYIVADIDGELEGTFDENLHTVTFYYRDASVAQVEELTDKWLKLKADADTYKQPDLSTIPEVDGLKAASEWQIISRMVTNKGLFWHELVDGRWVLYDRKKMIVIDGSSQPAIDVPEVKAFDWTPMPFDAAATIDFVAGESVTIYTQPYGHEVGTLAHGAKVQIKEVVTDPSGIRWYHVAHAGWLTSTYVAIDVL